MEGEAILQGGGPRVRARPGEEEYCPCRLAIEYAHEFERWCYWWCADGIACGVVDSLA